MKENNNKEHLKILQWAIPILLCYGVALLAYAAVRFDKNAEDHTDMKTDVAILSTESKQYRDDIQGLKTELGKVNDKLDSIIEKLQVRKYATST